MSRHKVGGIWLRFDDVLSEVSAIERVAKKFIEYDAPTILQQLSTEIRSSRYGVVGDARGWAIDERPLKTLVSSGDYERGGGGSHQLWAELTFRWEITLCDERGTTKRPHEFFALTGLASTRCRLLEGDPKAPTELAMWRMEVGGDTHPGCLFHVQILGQAPVLPFPKSLSVPRLPAILLTPADCLDFVLGEIFQDEWRQHAARETDEMNQWKRVQSVRLARLLRWKADCVASGVGSPWARLKGAHPPYDLFTSE